MIELMIVFLLIWSFKKWLWFELFDVVVCVKVGEVVYDVWGCGFVCGILLGDCVFLYCVVKEFKGVFGFGYVMCVLYEVFDLLMKCGYWLCIDFVYDWLVDVYQDVVIVCDVLCVYLYLVQIWDVQMFGMLIKLMVEGLFEKCWVELIGKCKLL